MSLLLAIMGCLNDILTNTLTCEGNADTSQGNDLKEDWYKQIHYSNDGEINRYLYKNGLHYNIEDDGRYKCEKILIDYFVDKNIDVYRI